MREQGKNRLHLSNWQYVIMMLVMVTVWALAFPFIKIGLEKLSFINLTIMRFLIVCITLSIVLLLQPKRFSKLRKKDIIPIFLLSSAQWMQFKATFLEGGF